MDPVGPWSAYAASYNRLANAGGFQNAGSTELHHHMGGGVQGTSAPTSQLLAAHATPGLAGSAASPFNPPGFLSPPPVGYDSVFTPLFHQKAHYGIQPRPIKQAEADPYNQMAPNNFFDQNSGPSIPWSQNSAQLPSPFGILPHESVVPNSPGAATKSYENFNAHFAAAQSLNQLSEYKNSPFVDPKKRASSPPKTVTSGPPFFQQMLTPPNESNVSTFKQNFQNGHVQQSYPIPPPTQGSQKEYRIPQPPKIQYPQQRSEKPRAFTPKQNNQKLKLYEDKKNEPESQSSPISYAMIDSQRGFQSTKLRSHQFQNIPNHQTYRFPMTPESDYQRSKSTESFGSTSSNPDCNIGMPRRPSPVHPQPSPSTHGHSPVYSMYNSPLTTISSPSPVQHDSCFNKQQAEVTPPLDVTIPRNNIPNTRNERYDKQDFSRQQWDERQRRYSGYESQNSQVKQFYDPGHQVTLQDLSSCRGDPMSLVKTLQQQHPEKVEEKPKKRRKSSSEKPLDSDYGSRIPPPAHNANQVNQNGYLDYDRWNLTSAPGKMFSTSPVAFSSQSGIGNNYANHQAQPLMVPHPGPPMPYYTPYPAIQPQSSETPDAPEIEEDRPKVIVPNIAEELQCLLEDNTVIKTPPLKRPPVKPIGPNHNAGFITSFMKFLQGEKESSPPPALRSPRRLVKPSIYPLQNSKEKGCDDPPVPEFPSDPQDDPRYFPLPKSSDKRNFNSSDSEFSEKDCPFSVKEEKKAETPPPTPLSEKVIPKTEDEISPAISSRKKVKKHKKKKKKKKSKRGEGCDPEVPRRQTSRRKAKENLYPLVDRVDDPEGRLVEFEEMESDPSWSPQVSTSDEDFRSLRPRRASARRKSKTLSFETSDEEDIPLSERTKKKAKRKTLRSSKKPSESAAKKEPPQIIYPSRVTGSKSNNFPYNIGEFVVLKSDIHLRHPPIWRVKEKTMLQKFLHFFKYGMSLYQNVPFYIGWSPESKNVYEGVVVKVVSMSKSDIVVELMSDGIQDVSPDDRCIINRIVESTTSYYDNFEVYIQTLFSQALDSNFLVEIFNENDEYFLLNVRAIDSVVSDLEKRLCDVLGWSERLISAIDMYSSYKCQLKGGTKCQCGAMGIQLVTLYGISYNKDTLEPENPLEDTSCLESVFCQDCLSNLEALYKLCHFKYTLFSICQEKVIAKKDEDPKKDTTLILNDLLADDTWISKVFKGVTTDWGFTESLIKKMSEHPTKPT